jgi:hypothetical protein
MAFLLIVSVVMMKETNNIGAYVLQSGWLMQVTRFNWWDEFHDVSENAMTVIESRRKMN